MLVTYLSEGRLGSARARVVIGDPPPAPPGPDPKPGPAPGPGPTPDPEPPPDGATSRLAAALATIDEPGKAARSAALARNYEGLAAQVAAGTIRDARTFESEFIAAARAALGTSGRLYGPFLRALATELNAAPQLEGRADVLRIAVAVLDG